MNHFYCIHVELQFFFLLLAHGGQDADCTSLEYQTDANGYKLIDSSGSPEIRIDKIDGMNIYLTIDSNVQMIVERALNNYFESSKDAIVCEIYGLSLNFNDIIWLLIKSLYQKK